MPDTIHHPELPGWVSQSWNIMTAATTATSPFTFRSQTTVWPGERVACVLELPPMRAEAGQRWQAFFRELGPAGTFWLSPSGFLRPSRPLGQPQTVGVVQGGVVPTDGWLPNLAPAMTAGQWVSIGGRLRQLLRDVTTDANGGAVLRVRPHVGTVGSGSVVEWREPRGRFKLQGEAPAMTWRVDKLMEGFTFSALEEDHDHA